MGYRRALTITIPAHEDDEYDIDDNNVTLFIKLILYSMLAYTMLCMCGIVFLCLLALLHSISKMCNFT